MTQITRRALLIAATTTPVALVAASAGVMPAAGHDADRFGAVSPDLARLIADHSAADIEICRFYRDVFNPACERQQERYDAVPHVVHQIVSMPGDNRQREWTTADRHDVACVFGIMNLTRAPICSTSEPVRSLRRREARSFWAAHLLRERKLKQILRDPAVVAADREEKRLLDLQDATLDAILSFASRSVADIHMKATLGEQIGREGEFLAAITADAARLVAEGA